ncbi:MAG: hypothetical protein GC131_07725 [Alphaproteobacteria bacterium]|nr:hypothetical protein [Alphaproteobacteria bacterium]
MKHVLLSSVAAIALTIAAPAFADAIDADDGDNTVKAEQTLSGGLNNSDSSVFNTTQDGNLDQRTGDIDYDNQTFDAEGVFTIQNQTGLNNVGNNGANIAAQVNIDDVELDDYADNVVKAKQTGTAKIENNSDVLIQSNNDSSEQPGDIGNTDTRTGDIDYDDETFNEEGVFTLQNQTGLNDAGNNLTNVAAQVSDDLELDDDSENYVFATQSGTATISNSDSTVQNDVFEDGELTNRTGDIEYGGDTFNAEGLYTLQNQTGQNGATNNATNIAAQVNNDVNDSITIEDDSVNAVVATQTLTSTISGSNALVDNNFQPNSYGDVSNRTGDVVYSSDTFNASGVYTLSNTTGLNNAGNNATNISAQVNGLAP